MLKKILLTSAIFVTSTSLSFANGVPYIGASAGVNSTTFDLKDKSKTNFDLGGRGVAGNLFAGYGGIVSQNVYLGGEAFANFTSTDSNFKVIDENVKGSLNNKYGYGVSFIPGVMLSDHTMAYGRVGVVRNRFETEISRPVSDSHSKTLTGGQFGVGMQTCLTQHVDLRGEYTYTTYNKASFNGVKVSPDSDQFNLGLVYKLD
jgi:opacity protein-like surface antigen